MTVTTAEKFRAYILEQLGFLETESSSYYQYFKNHSNDHYELYKKNECYEFGIADYTIPHDFKLSFSNPDRLIRFGTVYTGTTTFKLKNQDVSSFSPSSFFVVEDHISGKQAWKEGQHFHGIEITIYASYFDRMFEELTGSPFDYSTIQLNKTYHYLPLSIIKVLQELLGLSDSRHLNPIYLESKVLECIAIFYHELSLDHPDRFSHRLQRESIRIGNRSIYLTPTDIQSIHKAHRILSEQYLDPPTIETLSKLVLLNSQKLKAGFSHHYHLTIGEYTTSLRMSAAATLLCTTRRHIHDIANEVGYSNAANFIRMFKQYYKQTPLQYRNTHPNR